MDQKSSSNQKVVVFNTHFHLPNELKQINFLNKYCRAHHVENFLFWGRPHPRKASNAIVIAKQIKVTTTHKFKIY